MTPRQDDTAKDRERDKGMAELRSPRMRQLLDDIPGRLTFWLVVLSLLAVTALVAAAALLPYPYSRGESILQHVL